MQKKYNWIYRGMAIIFCFILLYLFACVPKAPKEQKEPKERQAALSVMPTTAQAGAVIFISGYQFLPGEEVEVIMTVGEVHHSLGTEKEDVIVANDKGAFEVKSGIPVKTPKGNYKITAMGNKGSMATFNISVIP